MPVAIDDNSWLRVPLDGLSRINGNDALVLLCNGAEVDRIGDNSVVKTGWDVGGVKDATADHLLVRKPSVVFGNGGQWQKSAETEFEVTKIEDESQILEVHFLLLYG